jgi:hypothetical protein
MPVLVLVQRHVSQTPSNYIISQSVLFRRIEHVKENTVNIHISIYGLLCNAVFIRFIPSKLIDSEQDIL